MEKAKVKKLLQKLKLTLSELESEVYSDTNSYVSYDDILIYYQNENDDDEEGL